MNAYYLSWQHRAAIYKNEPLLINWEANKPFFYPLSRISLFQINQIKDLPLSKQQKINLYYFHKYLLDVSTLETDIVINTCNAIITDSLRVKFSLEDKIKATTIVIDEGYHTLQAKLALESVNQLIDLPSIHNNQPGFSELLAGIQVPYIYKAEFFFIATSLSENTLTKDLDLFIRSNDPQDLGCNNFFKRFIQMHFSDEASHTVFFSELLKTFWQNLDVEIKNTLKPFVLGVINLLEQSYKTQDIAFARYVLLQEGFGLGEIELIIEELQNILPWKNQLLIQSMYKMVEYAGII